jgi:hypothetical protein
MARPYLTAEAAKQLVRKHALASPRRRNPVDTQSDTCLYTSWDGKRHCIIGQIAADEFGRSLPPTVQASVGTSAVHPLLPFRAAPSTIDLLSEIQQVFDGGWSTAQDPDDRKNVGAGRRTWGSALNLCEKAGLL